LSGDELESSGKVLELLGLELGGLVVLSETLWIFFLVSQYRVESAMKKKKKKKTKKKQNLVRKDFQELDQQDTIVKVEFQVVDLQGAVSQEGVGPSGEGLLLDIDPGSLSGGLFRHVNVDVLCMLSSFDSIRSVFLFREKRN